MISDLILSVSVSSTVLQAAQGPEPYLGQLADIFGIVSGLISLALFAMSIYAWIRRKQSSLIFVSIAFLLYFFSIIADVYDFGPEGVSDLIAVVLDLAILVFIFLGLVVKPKVKEA